MRRLGHFERTREVDEINLEFRDLIQIRTYLFRSLPFAVL
jgi:hypothetical protein